MKLITIYLPLFIVSMFCNRYFKFLKIYFFIPYNFNDSKFTLIKRVNIIILPTTVVNKIRLVELETNIFYSYKNTLIIINSDEVIKISHSRGKDLNIRNYQSLMRIQEFKCSNLFPKPLDNIVTSDFAISSETFLDGDLTTNTTYKNMFLSDVSNIIATLCRLYNETSMEVRINQEAIRQSKQFLRNVPIDYKESYSNLSIPIDKANSNINQNIQICLIHGDLTFDNITKKDSEYYFYYVDRMCHSFPEFDLINLMLYKKGTTYSDLLSTFKTKSFKAKLRINLDILYNYCPSFRNNAQHIEIIEKLWINRFVSYYLSDTSFDIRRENEIINISEVLKK